MATLLSSLETKARRVLLEPADLASPGIPTVTNIGTAGATSYTYKVVAINATGTTEASTGTTTATGNATLNSSNYNRITWATVTNATGYWIFRTASGGSPSTTGRIATLGAVTTYDDQGAAGDSSTAPSSNTTGLNSPLWSSTELVDLLNLGIKDLWGAIIDLNQEHFLTIDTTSVSISASATTMSGVPTDVFRVHLIEPTNITTSGSFYSTVFRPADYNSKAFEAARAAAAFDPTQPNIIYYCLISAGAPVAAPTVQVAPALTQAMTAGSIRFVYVPTAPAKTSSDDNPIPGESDNALIAWCIAYALSKDREDRSPDPNWLGIYKTEKDNILTRLTPRQDQEPDVVEDFFGDWW